MKKMNIHVGRLEDMGQRFADAFKRAEAGEDVDERHLTFPSLDEMMSALTPKRLELLRHLHREEADNIKALASTLGRDYKRVYQDVKTLESAGLIVREAGKIGVPWTALSAEVTL